MPSSLPSVESVAKALVSRFEKVFRREFVDLSDRDRDGVDDGLGGGDEVGELDKMREMVAVAEEEAKKAYDLAGGWPKEPDLSKLAM